MKNHLLRTSALVGAGLLIGAGAGQGANAAEPLSLSIGGYLNVAGIGIIDESDEAVGGDAEGTRDFTVQQDGELQFTAKTTLDNGIEVGARIEYEATNQKAGANILDERYVWFEGAFGQIKLGSDDPPGSAMAYVPPVAEGLGGVCSASFAVAVDANDAQTTCIADAGGDTHKIIYFSPRVQGFQLGLSYQPDDTIFEGFSSGGRDNDAGTQGDGFGVAGNFVGTFNEVDLAVSAGANFFELEAPQVGADDFDEWVVGVNVGFSGFTVGASYYSTNDGKTGDNDEFDVAAGITYGTGPWTVGFVYLHGEAEQGAGVADDEVDAWQVSAAYSLGPGVTLAVGVKDYDFDNSDGSLEQDPTFAYFVTKVSF